MLLKRENFCVFNEIDFVYSLHIEFFFVCVFKNKIYSLEKKMGDLCDEH